MAYGVVAGVRPPVARTEAHSLRGIHRCLHAVTRHIEERIGLGDTDHHTIPVLPRM